METQQKIHIGQIINKLADKKNLKAPDLAYMLGRSQANIHQIYNRPDVSTGLLFELSGVLGEPIAAFFEDHYERVEVKVFQADAKTDNEVKHLKALLQEKDERLRLQQDLIDLQRAQLQK